MSDKCIECGKPRTYQGWSNYETWAAKLWIDNDEPSYRYWREETRLAWGSAAGTPPLYPSQTRHERARILLAESLKSAFEESAPELHGVWADLLGAALSEVDWFEIARAMLFDMDAEASADA